MGLLKGAKMCGERCRSRNHLDPSDNVERTQISEPSSAVPFERKGRGQQFLAIEPSDQASCWLYRCRASLWPCTGAAGVASSPDARGRGASA